MSKLTYIRCGDYDIPNLTLSEQPLAALVSGPGNSGLPLAALDDGDFEMRTRNRHHPR